MIDVKTDGLRHLRDVLAEMQVNVKKEMRVAAWKAQKRGRTEVAKELAKTIRQPAKLLKKASYGKMVDEGFVFVIRGNFRIALKKFRPRHIKTGVTANVTKGTVAVTQTGRARRFKTANNYPGAFMGPRPGVPAAKLHGHPMYREGKKRLPIRRVPAVNLTTTIAALNWMPPRLAQLLRLELFKQVKERIRFLKVKIAGKLRNQKQ
jgi:hypothetical protein